jgi:hypothetical protein
VIGAAGTAVTLLVVGDLGGLSGPLVGGMALVGGAAAILDQRFESLAVVLAGGALALGAWFVRAALLEAGSAEFGWYAGTAVFTVISALILGTAMGWVIAAGIAATARRIVRRARHDGDRSWRFTERRW